MTECIKHGPHAPGECPECDELAEARSIVATTYIPPAPLSEDPVLEFKDVACHRNSDDETVEISDGISLCILEPDEAVALRDWLNKVLP